MSVGVNRAQWSEEPLDWRAHFSQLSGWLESQLRGDEGYALSLAGEMSEFIRLNRAKIRQAGEVTQGKLNLAYLNLT